MAHVLRCGDKQVHNATGVGNAYIFRFDLILPRAIVVIAERDADGRRLKTKFLVSSGFTGPPAHQATLERKAWILRVKLARYFHQITPPFPIPNPDSNPQTKQHSFPPLLP